MQKHSNILVYKFGLPQNEIQKIELPLNPEQQRKLKNYSRVYTVFTSGHSGKK